MVAKRTTIVWAAIGGLACTDFSIDDADQGTMKPVVIEETFLQDPTPRVDVLWMMDNTLSMELEQAHLRTNIDKFVSELDAHNVAWHIGVITPDGQGILEGNPWVLTERNSTTDDLSDTLMVGLDGTLPQSGLAAIVSALSEPLVSTTNAGFRRNNAALHVIAYSDGDDQSDSLFGSNPVNAVLDLLNQEQERTGLPSTMSAVVGSAPSGCIGPYGGATAGERYIAAAEQIGGLSSSICDPDLKAIAQDVTDISITLSDRFTLQAMPKPETVRVAIDGVRIDDGWTVEAQSILFSMKPSYGATIKIRYEVVQ